MDTKPEIDSALLSTVIAIGVLTRFSKDRAFDTTGRVLTIDAQPTETVQGVKVMVEELVQSPASLHSLNYKGTRLQEAATMKEHGIPDRATLRLILTALPHNCAEDSSVHDAAAMIALAGDIDQMGPRFLDLLSGRSGWNSCMGNGAGEKSEEMGRLRVYGDLGTLYARCGGIFGIAAFMDCCMDKWMADATLSANAAVATWHERAQRCGFKFLITQLMCYLTGGPQRYTGRSMVQAHKHLNISCIEWRSFMKVFGSVCSELGLPALDAEDLAAILDSLEEECVVHHGEQVPPNPGRDVHVGKCLYSKLGGCIPWLSLLTALLMRWLQIPECASQWTARSATRPR